jgi:hypothetical protein
VRKIISILVALGLVLGLSAIATPVAANVTTPGVVLSDDCACHRSSYNITFNITASLTEGAGCVCIKFPEGTDVPATFADGDIVINGEDVFGVEVTVSGTEVCFIPPADIDDPGPVWVFFETGPTIGIKNPCTPGPYQLEVKTCRAPDATYVKSVVYNILPEHSTYEFVVDFDDTYPGIAEDFIPPFKMCGQNVSEQNEYSMDAFTTVWDPIAGGYADLFDIIYRTDVLGCDTPCDNVTVWMEVVTCPAGEVIHLGFNTSYFTLGHSDETVTKGVYDSTKDKILVDELPLEVDLEVVWNATLHFSSPGKYEICIYADCPEVIGCDPEESTRQGSKCMKFSVYQWKEAFKIPLCRKWNLISLPLVPLVDPPISTADKTGIFDSYALLDQVLSIWYYDRGAPTCNGQWLNWPAPGTLTDMEDGKAYWVRIVYNSTHPMGSPADGLWVFGTLKPTPTNPPSAYPVCDGWNMVGYTEVAPMNEEDYLWNFPAGVGGWGAVYGWDNCGWYGPAQSWVLMSPQTWMLWPGDGYWISFDGPGTIFPP